jgi:hypothetical protein
MSQNNYTVIENALNYYSQYPEQIGNHNFHPVNVQMFDDTPFVDKLNINDIVYGPFKIDGNVVYTFSIVSHASHGRVNLKTKSRDGSYEHNRELSKNSNDLNNFYKVFHREVKTGGKSRKSKKSRKTRKTRKSKKSRKSRKM